MSERKEFVLLTLKKEIPFSQLCRRYGIHRDTDYKWLSRYLTLGEAGLADQSRRPRSSPDKTSETIERLVLTARNQWPHWGGRKLRRHLQNTGHRAVPSASTITAILRRHGQLNPALANVPRDWQRFEAPTPNALWQMDFKGHFAIDVGRCHPLTVLDDHSRYSLGIGAWDAENGANVRTSLIQIFRRYRLPASMLMDNGGPWGIGGEYTPLTVWLLRLNIKVIHERPRHPQTQGKLEWFHRTLKAEIALACQQLTLSQCQQRLERWRYEYNYQRPHESLDLAVPATRYCASAINYPETLPNIEYGPDDIIRKVQAEGWFSYLNRDFRVSKAFRGEPIALRHASQDGAFDLFYCRFNIGQINLAQPR
jgi:transposase InsO family protein